MPQAERASSLAPVGDRARAVPRPRRPLAVVRGLRKLIAFLAFGTSVREHTVLRTAAGSENRGVALGAGQPPGLVGDRRRGAARPVLGRRVGDVRLDAGVVLPGRLVGDVAAAVAVLVDVL